MLTKSNSRQVKALNSLPFNLADWDDLDLFTKLRCEGSPLVDEPEFVRFEKWVEQINHTPAPTEQVLHSPADYQLPAGASVDFQIGRGYANQPGELSANATDGLPDGKHDSSCFRLLN